jgi:protein-disulfide isomerase
LVTAQIDKDSLNKCIEEVKTTFKTEEDYNNKAEWLSGAYPKYRVNDELNTQYGVQGSPTLVVNGIKVNPVSRSPKAYLDAICE